MDNEANKVKLAELNDDSLKQKEHMEELRGPIIKYISTMLKSQIDTKVKDIVVHSQASFSKNLGADTITRLKLEVKNMIDSMDSTVESVFSDDSLWLHKGKIELHITPNENHTMSAKMRHISNGIELVQKTPIQLLESYKYSHVRSSFDGYAGGDPVLIDLIRNYAKEMIKWHMIMREIQSLEHTIDSTDVADIWGD